MATPAAERRQPIIPIEHFHEGSPGLFIEEDGRVYQWVAGTHTEINKEINRTAVSAMRKNGGDYVADPRYYQKFTPEEWTLFAQHYFGNFAIDKVVVTAESGWSEQRFILDAYVEVFSPAGARFLLKRNTEALKKYASQVTAVGPQPRDFSHVDTELGELVRLMQHSQSEQAGEVARVTQAKEILLTLHQVISFILLSDIVTDQHFLIGRLQQLHALVRNLYASEVRDDISSLVTFEIAPVFDAHVAPVLLTMIKDLKPEDVYLNWPRV